MNHLTVDEILDFVTMTELSDTALRNAAEVTGHITECRDCLRKVRAFQLIYDEFETLSRTRCSGQDFYHWAENRADETLASTGETVKRKK